LGFLLGNEFETLINENGESFELDGKMFIKIQNPQYRLIIEFKKNPVSLVGWEFKNQMGETISILLKNIKTNDYMSDEIFKTEKDYERVKK
jgi:outer membrane lipoprotein-sorting protein